MLFIHHESLPEQMKEKEEEERKKEEKEERNKNGYRIMVFIQGPGKSITKLHLKP